MDSLCRDGFLASPSIEDICEIVSAGAGTNRPVVISVGLPLCSDGTAIRFGSGEFDPIDERRLLHLPSGASEAAERDGEIALKVCERLRHRIADGSLKVNRTGFPGGPIF